MDPEGTVREYYAALDDHRYDDLRGILAPGFTQHRPDRTFEDRAAFVAFVREDRPHSDTTHDIDGVYTHTNGATGPGSDATDRTTARPSDSDSHALASGERETVLARGTVRTDDGTTIVRFVDCFDVLADRIVALDTYTR